MVAVEPQAPLRERLAATMGSERVRDGLAEAIPLPDAAVDAVTVADGFHWFDQARALVEIDRVLRPGGGLAIVSTIPDWSGASWAHELGDAGRSASAPSTRTSMGRLGRRRCALPGAGRSRGRFA